MNLAKQKYPRKKIAKKEACRENSRSLSQKAQHTSADTMPAAAAAAVATVYL